MAKSAIKAGMENLQQECKAVIIGKGKYAGYFIRRKKDEKTFKFVRRIIKDVVLQVNSSITVSTMIKDLQELTGMKITKWFMLSTFFFKDSGILTVNNIIWASEADEKLARNIVRAAEREISKAGGKIEKYELFFCIRQASNRLNLSEKFLSSTLLNKRNSLRWRTQGGKTMVFLKK